MNPKRRNRLVLVILMMAGVGLSVTLALTALDQNLLYYFNPSQVKSGEAPVNHSFTLGGLVADGSVKRDKDGMTVHFDVTDTIETIAVTYTGILPDLFREGQGVVANGKLDGSHIDRSGTRVAHFIAEEVLAKHDENYTPPQVQEDLDKAALIKQAAAEKASSKASDNVSTALSEVQQ